ncbi:MAG TPA: DUF5665 domain-containing protein [Oscillospiraceae bacterium]|nr:DUF5665 domain-containing protein [Oscillospiraceae bacterium]
MSKNKDNPRDSEIHDRVDHIEKIPRRMDNIGVAEYIEMISNPKRVIFMNFIAGLTRGLGMGIGFTVLAGIVLYLMRSWVNLPVVGRLIAELLDIIDAYR